MRFLAVLSVGALTLHAALLLVDNPILFLAPVALAGFWFILLFKRDG